MECKHCGKDLTGQQESYCSNKCKTYFWQKEHGFRRKRQLVDLLGGKCKICGYNRNLAALVFHHINPAEKVFELDARKMTNTSWERLCQEASKCAVLCQNCHMEEHHPRMNGK